MKWIVLAVVTAAMSKASPIENGVQDLVKRASSAEVANVCQTVTPI